MTAHGPLLLGGGDIPGIAWPALHSDKVAPLASHFHQLEATQWLSREELEAGQQLQLATIAKWFEARMPAFQGRLSAGGLSAADLFDRSGFAALTPLTRRNLIATHEQRFNHALPPGHAPAGAVRTSGSTGEPVTVWRTGVNNLDWLATTLRYHSWGEPDFGARLASIRALTLRIGEFADWGTPISHFFNTGLMLSLPANQNVETLATKLLAFDPHSLVAFPSQLVALMSVLDRRDERFAALTRVRTMGETLSPVLRAALAAQWEVAVHDCYSSEEVGYIALQCPDSDLYHTMDELLIVEVIDKAGRACIPGEIGRVIVTDLRNHATPLIRYAIGDYAVRGGVCPCGRGLATLEHIAGRARNMIRGPDGRLRWPVVSSIGYRDIAPITQSQIIQHSVDQLEVRLVCERALTNAEEERLRDLIVKDRLAQPFDVTFAYFSESLPNGPTGKFEEFISMIGVGQ